ncbi:MAG TPA: SCO family protein [Pyrinomonadaceae bacterium]|jgi:protein SCO1/2
MKRFSSNYPKAQTSRRQLPEGFSYLLAALCLLAAVCPLRVLAQGGMTGRQYNGTSPLYSPRGGETGPNGLPKALREVGIEQKLNGQLPLDLVFRDETGREVRLREYFGSKPVVLALVYYECPMLCNQVLNGMTGSLKTLSFNIGEQFDVLTISFDPRERPELARAKKETYLRSYGNRPGAAEGWHFLTGDDQSIKTLTEAVGFKYYYDAETNQFAHASGIMILTPQGKLARYFYGIEYAPRDVRLGIVEASENKIGSHVDQLLLYCYHYDPATGKYGPVVMNIIRLGGVVTVLGIIALILLLVLRNRQTLREHPAAGGTA